MSQPGPDEFNRRVEKKLAGSKVVFSAATSWGSVEVIESNRGDSYTIVATEEKTGAKKNTPGYRDAREAIRDAKSIARQKELSAGDNAGLDSHATDPAKLSGSVEKVCPNCGRTVRVLEGDPCPVCQAPLPKKLISGTEKADNPDLNDQQKKEVPMSKIDGPGAFDGEVEKRMKNLGDYGRSIKLAYKGKIIEIEPTPSGFDLINPVSEGPFKSKEEALRWAKEFIDNHE